MRRAFRLSLSLAAFCCLAAGPPADDRRDVETVMRRHDPSLATFRIEGKKTLTDTESIFLIRGPKLPLTFSCCGP